MADARIEDLFKGTNPGRSWYETLEGKELEFVDALTARTVQAGQLPNINGTCRILSEEFGDPVTANTVRKHFRRALIEGRS